MPPRVVRRAFGLAWVLAFMLTAACRGSSSGGGPGTGGSGATGGAATDGGATGGTATGRGSGVDAGASDSGGDQIASGGRDSPANGGNASGGGGMKGGSPGAGGGAAGGALAGGTTGSAGGMGGAGSDSADAPQPSPGCRLAKAQPPERTTDATFGLAVARKFPPTYDGVTPMPLIFALHATNFPASYAVMDLVKDQPMAARYVIVAPQEKLENPSNFEGREPADFSQMMANVLDELCVDQGRIFAVGNGSGGRALVRWTSYMARATATPTVPPVRAFAMVGTFIGGNAGPHPGTTIFIHPLTSNNSRAVGDEDGTKALAVFLKRNQCSEATVPVAAASCVAEGMPVDPGCVDFEGCALPFRFCHHDDLTKQTSGDPWTCMASPAIYQFFERFL